MTEPVKLYVEDANGTVYLAEQAGWLSTPERFGNRFSVHSKLYDDDEPLFRLVEQKQVGGDRG